MVCRQLSRPWRTPHGDMPPPTADSPWERAGRLHTQGNRPGPSPRGQEEDLDLAVGPLLVLGVVGPRPLHEGPGLLALVALEPAGEHRPGAALAADLALGVGLDVDDPDRLLGAAEVGAGDQPVLTTGYGEQGRRARLSALA